ncbi:MAG TPA: right-handed parallel beta-helix repeat-containing protein [Streptosporangiaceae bacterium]|nr:right-handed parallel beta-helix repeat-containing protein [Streptosporangiaceae bacterium]
MGKKNVRLLRATAAGCAAATIAALALAAPAAAAPAAATVRVPCSPAALSSAITGAVSGETLVLSASCRYVLTAALPPVAVSLTVRGNDATLERSPAAGTPAFGILTVTGPQSGPGTTDVSVSHVTFRNGSAGAITIPSAEQAPGTLTVTSDTFTGNTGGAINMSTSYALAVSHSTFTGNGGGAINTPGLYTGPEEQPQYAPVTDSRFLDNTGGAINCLEGGSGCYVTVAGSTFIRNTGSAISLSTFGDIEATRSIFADNTGYAGGAIAINSPNAALLTATDDIFTGNTATTVGGAIYNFDGLTATGDTFIKNSATRNGGAIDNEWVADVQGSTFRQNHAADGGALYSADRMSVNSSILVQNTASDGGAIEQAPNGLSPQPTTLSITGSQILRNQAAQYGGGIINALASIPPGPPPGSVAINTTTIRGNKAGTDGGGIENTPPGAVTLTQSPVDNNDPDNCAPPQSVPGCVN